MRFRFEKLYGALLLMLAIAPDGFANDVLPVPAHESDVTNAVPVSFAVETSGPMRAPKAVKTLIPARA